MYFHLELRLIEAILFWLITCVTVFLLAHLLFLWWKLLIPLIYLAPIFTGLNLWVYVIMVSAPFAILNLPAFYFWGSLGKETKWKIGDLDPKYLVAYLSMLPVQWSCLLLGLTCLRFELFSREFRNYTWDFEFLPFLFPHLIAIALWGLKVHRTKRQREEEQRLG